MSATPFYLGNPILRNVDASDIIHTRTLTSTDSVYNSNGGFTFISDLATDSAGNNDGCW